MRKNKKDWTVLVYANGNNELEPEMWQCKLALEKIGSSESVNVVLELGRESRELVEIIRPKDTLPFVTEVWTGVRRYYIEKSNSLLIKNLGKINMADYRTLYDFITWGIQSYPAKKYMLIISGHGASFISVLPDFSQDMPYMMGVFEMCKAINRVKNEIGIQLDLLVLDICYMNLIEILYELGKEKVNTVKNLITYVKSGPIGGLPYNKLIEVLHKTNSALDTNLFLKQIIDEVQLNLVAIQINHSKLERIKTLFSKLAYTHLMDNGWKENSTVEVFAYYNKQNLFKKYIKEVENKLFSLVIHYKIIYPTDSKLINITTRGKYKVSGIDAFLPFYYKLSFSKNNYWTYIVSNKGLGEPIHFKEPLLSLFHVSSKGIITIIWAVNPTLREDEINSIVEKLYLYKGWRKN